MSADATESTGTTGTAGPDQWGFDTLQVHAGQQPDPSTGARALPIFQTTAYVFPDADSAAGRFALTEPGHIYTRLNNPTQDAVEGRVAALEGGTAALLLASGQSATTYAILNVADSGDHIVASRSLYGGTFNLLKVTLGRLGIETTFVDPDDPAAWRDAVRENTKLFFGESIPNPKGDVFDIESVAEVAREAGVPLVIDNTVATPYLLRPFDHGANVVVHSATKFLGGHGTALAGVAYLLAGQATGLGVLLLALLSFDRREEWLPPARTRLPGADPAPCILPAYASDRPRWEQKSSRPAPRRRAGWCRAPPRWRDGAPAGRRPGRRPRRPRPARAAEWPVRYQSAPAACGQRPVLGMPARAAPERHPNPGQSAVRPASESPTRR